MIEKTSWRSFPFYPIIALEHEFRTERSTVFCALPQMRLDDACAKSQADRKVYKSRIKHSNRSKMDVCTIDINCGAGAVGECELCGNFFCRKHGNREEQLCNNCRRSEEESGEDEPF